MPAALYALMVRHGAAGGNPGGDGGDTSVGSLVVAKGGSGGNFSSTAQFGSGGTGGLASSGTGDVKTNGTQGDTGFYMQTAINIIFACGTGGSSSWGDRGKAGVAVQATSANGNAATGYGAGGGAAGSNEVAENKAGGAGAPGFVVITEFIA